MFKVQPRLKYTDNRGNTVSESSHHPGLFIIDQGKTFYSISSTQELIKRSHPPKIYNQNGQNKISGK